MVTIKLADSAFTKAIALHHARMWARADHRTVVGFLSSDWAWDGPRSGVSDASIESAFSDPDCYADSTPPTLRAEHVPSGARPVARRSV